MDANPCPELGVPHGVPAVLLCHIQPFRCSLSRTQQQHRLPLSPHLAMHEVPPAFICLPPSLFTGINPSSPHDHFDKECWALAPATPAWPCLDGCSGSSRICATGALSSKALFCSQVCVWHSIPGQCRAKAVSSLVPPVLLHRRLGSRCSCVHISGTGINGKQLMGSSVIHSLKGPLHTHTGGAQHQQLHGTCCPSHTHWLLWGPEHCLHPRQSCGGTAASQPFPARKMGKISSNTMERAQCIQPIQPVLELNPCSHAEPCTNVPVATESSPNGDFN